MQARMRAPPWPQRRWNLARGRSPTVVFGTSPIRDRTAAPVYSIEIARPVVIRNGVDFAMGGC